MPSTSKKQHNFMEAIAHSPSFAKKVGVSQSVGKDFSAADKGRKFGHGGALNKQNTQHGKMDMPFKSLKRFAGMKSGGMAKRYAEGGDVDSMSFGKAFRQKLDELGEGKTFTWKGKSYTTDLAKPKNPVTKSTPAAKSTPSNTTNSGAVTGRASPIAKKMVGETASGYPQTQDQEDAYVARLSKEPEDTMPPYLGFSKGKVDTGMKGGGNVKYNFEKSGKDVEKKGMKEGSKKEESFYRTQMKYAKGGSVMRPKKDIARDQMAMAPYAKGGGIESKGKTQGKMIKMATGGIVKFARGGGIESRGKTRGKMF